MRSRTTLLLASAGVCWTLGQAVLPDMAMQTAARYELVAGNRGAEALSAALLVVAGCLLVLSAMSIVRLVSERGLTGTRGSRLIAIGAACVGLGGVWLVGGRAAFNMMLLRATHPDVPRDSAIALLEAPQGLEFLPLVLTLPALLLGPILLGVGVRRARLGNWLPLVLWVVGIGIFIGTEFSVKAGEITGIAVASSGLVLLGRALGSVADDPREVGSAAPAAGPSDVDLLRAD